MSVRAHTLGEVGLAEALAARRLTKPASRAGDMMGQDGSVLSFRAAGSHVQPI